MYYTYNLSADVAPVFKLSDLYSPGLEQLGVQQNSRPHSTDLKNCILAQLNFQSLKPLRKLLDLITMWVQLCIKHVKYTWQEQPRLYAEIF